MPIQPINIADKLAYNISAKEYATTINRIAKRNEDVAWDIISEGIRGNVRAKDVIRISNKDCPGAYTDNGELTEKGLKEMKNFLMETFGLKKEADAEKITVKQLIDHFAKKTK